MELRFTPEELAFRDEVRAFLKNAVPVPIRRKVEFGQRLSKDEMVSWVKILHAKGWSCPAWAPEWGGQAWTSTQHYIFKEELHMAPAPEPISFNMNMIGPVLIAFGSQAQKEHFLPRVASMDYWFCQGFSEPGSGSDLASLRTSAVRDGDHYVLNGQKIWTSTAHHADWCFMLVRTDATAKKQQGISFLLMDMKTPGITIRPIITLDGYHETNEMFLDNVRVPVENLVGQENFGWDVAKFLLGSERGGIARVGLSKFRVRRAKQLARQVPAGEGMLADEPRFRERVAALEVELKALEMTQMRVIADSEKFSHAPDPRSSILKMKGSELQQAATELLLEVAGYNALEYDHAFVLGNREVDSDDDWARTIAPNYYFARHVSIVGGSNEIQHNILAKTLLGL